MHMDDDYREGDQYDWDQSDENQYCPHGQFIGSWWGPDILCRFCEDGVTKTEFEEIMAAEYHRNLVTMATRNVYDDMIPVIKSRTHHDPDKLSAWFRHVIDEVRATDDATLEKYLSR